MRASVVTLAVVACSVTGCVETATQAVVFFEAEPAVAARARWVVISTFDSEGEQTEQREPLDGVRLSFPFFQPMFPRNGDAARQWRVSASLFDTASEPGAEDTPFAVQTAAGTYFANERREFVRTFRSECVDVIRCGAFGTCDGGDCVSAWEGDDAPPPDRVSLAAFVERVETSSEAELEEGSVSFTPDGNDWLVVISGEIGTEGQDGNNAVELFYTVNGVERGRGGTVNTAPGAGGAFQHFDVIRGSTLNQTVRVFLSAPTGASAYASNLRVLALPLPEGSVVSFAETDEIPLEPNCAGCELELSADGSPGEELVFLAAYSSAEPANFRDGIDAISRVILPDGEELGFTNPRAARETQFVALEHRLETATARMQVSGRSREGTTSLRDVRMLALRSDAFFNIEYATSSRGRLTEPSVLVESSVSAPGEARERLILMSTALGSAGGDDCARVASFAVEPGPSLGFRHVVENLSLRTTYGMFVLDVGDRPFALRVAAEANAGCFFEPSWTSVLVLTL